jgi:hypothetical protein
MLEESKPVTSNISRKEFMALKSLQDNKEIRILQTDKGNCMVVLNESIYKKIPYYNQRFIKLYIRIPHLKLRGRYGNFLPSIKLSFLLP